MKTINFSQMLNQITATVNRFPFTVFSVAGLVLMMMSDINQWELRNNSSLWILFLMSIPATLASSLFTEKKFSKLNSILITLTVYALIVVYSLLFVKDTMADLERVQHAIIILMLVLLNFVAPFIGSKDENNTWEFARKSVLQLIISGLFAGILFAGLALATFAVETLFQYKSQGDRLYGNFAVLSFLGFAPLYFLSQIPSVSQLQKLKADFNNVIRFLGLFILQPLVVLYLGIIYVYLFKILFNWELPVGMVSVPVTILGVGAILTFMVLKPLYGNSEYKIVDLFRKIFPYLFLPVLILMSVGIARRIGEYGITYNRLLVMILNLWFYGISLYVIFTKTLKIKHVILSFVAFGLLSCIGPWNVFKMDKKFRVDNVELKIESEKN